MRLLAAAGAATLLLASQTQEVPGGTQRCQLTYRVVPEPAAAGTVIHVSIQAAQCGSLPTWEPGAQDAQSYMSHWELQELPNHTTRITYDVALGRMAQRERDPDTATTAGPATTVLTDGALLWRPEDLPEDSSVEVALVDAPQLPWVAPWEPKPGAPGVYNVTATQLEGGAYLLLGAHERLPVKDVGGPLSAVVAGGQVMKASAGELAAWVEESVATVALWNGGRMPVPRVQLILLPGPGEDATGFGTTMRWGLGSIVLYVGRDAPAAAFHGDWVAPHELFHLANPHLARRLPWFTEGFTTYFQDLIRARAGTRTAEAMWDDLGTGIRRSCGSSHLQTLEEASNTLRLTHQYQRVYWGGACVAFLMDVALRTSPGVFPTLDALYKHLRLQSLEDPPTQEELVAALHAALAPGHPAHLWLDQALTRRTAIPVDLLLARLGVSPRDPAAPWHPVALGIMAPPGQVPASAKLPLPPAWPLP